MAGSEGVAAVVWVILCALGMLFSARAFLRGLRRYMRSSDEVAVSVHVAEFLTGAILFFVFFAALSTAITSLFILPLHGPMQPPTEYQEFRAMVVRWQFVAEKAILVMVVFIPEILDRRLTRIAERQARADEGEGA